MPTQLQFSTCAALFAGMWAVCTGNAGAQTATSRGMSPSEVLQTAQANAGTLDQLRAGLRSPDPSTRASTFVAMVESNNASLVTLAINEARAVSDPTLRDMAARAAVAELAMLVFEPKDAPPAEVLPALQYHAPGLRPQIKKYSWRTGVLEFPGGYGQVSGGTLAYKNDACTGTLTATDATWVYEGRVQCVTGSQRLSEAMRVRIR